MGPTQTYDNASPPVSKKKKRPKAQPTPVEDVSMSVEDAVMGDAAVEDSCLSEPGKPGVLLEDASSLPNEEIIATDGAGQRAKKPKKKKQPVVAVAAGADVN